MNLRHARLEDATQLADLVLLFISEMGGSPPTLPRMLSYVQTFILHGRGVYVVAEEDGAIVGCAQVHLDQSFWHCAPVAYVQSVYVAESHRRRGVVRGLLALAERFARKAGGAEIILDVHQNNRPAKAIYRAAGFQENGCLIMLKDLRE